MKKKKQEQQINYLDLIPVKAEGLKWHKDFRDRVILEVKNEVFLTGSHRKYLTARKSQSTSGCTWKLSLAFYRWRENRHGSGCSGKRAVW